MNFNFSRNIGFLNEEFNFVVVKDKTIYVHFYRMYCYNIVESYHMPLFQNIFCIQCAPCHLSCLAL